MTNKKVKVLADLFRVYNEYNEYRQPQLQYGYVDHHKGDVVDVPDWVADSVLKLGVQSPNGAFRPAAIPAGDDESDHVVKGFREDVSANPEVDFGTSTVAGNLVSDPDNKLQKQRQDARKAELSPAPQRPPAQRPAPDKR